MVKHKKRVYSFLVSVVNLDKSPKYNKDLWSSEPERAQPRLGVGCPNVVTYKVGTSSALELVSSAIFTWRSGPGCDSSHLK